jgi:hypothetical protein
MRFRGILDGRQAVVPVESILLELWKYSDGKTFWRHGSMIKSVLCLVTGVIFLAGCISVHTTKHTPAPETTLLEVPEPAKEPAQVLRHMVLFKFKDDTTKEQIKKVESAFCALPAKINVIHDFEWGTNVSPENRSQGFTHCFVVTFLSEADRAIYLPHPAHKEFAATLGPYLDQVLVIDYWTKP